MTAKMIEIDVEELAVRLCEANYGIVRPTPSAQHALDNMDLPVRRAWLRTANAAADYVLELIDNAKTVQ